MCGSPDAIASILIGLVLAGVALLLARESRHLLVGESADPDVVDHIQVLANANPDIERADRPMTMHLSPHDVLLTLNLQFRSDLSADEVTATVDRLEQQIRQAHPDITRIFIEAENLTRQVQQTM